MSNYTKTTDFEAKDSLPTGDSGKIIRGAEFETEFDAISTAIATKADTAGPTFTGTATFATTNATTVQIGGVAITSTAAELNTLDGITSTTAELNTLDGFTGTVDDLNYAKDLRASGVTSAEFDILDGLTATADELNILDGATVTTAELNLLDGVTATTAELNYVDGVTSSIQTQIDTKSPTASPTFTGTVTIPTVDINAGTIDGTDVTVGTGKTLDVSSGTLTLADDQISGDKVEGGTIASTTITDLASTTVDTTNLEVTNIKAKDGTSAGSIADTTGVVTLASSVLTTTDINGGTIDGTIIGGTTAAAGSFTTISATGNITVDGTVDGRDVATDGTKLDGIEAGADVTDTTNVTAAGALMDSELTDITAVKSLNQGVATTDTPSFTGLTTTADVSFGDNDKAIFGAGSDLQIYHDGNNSFITDGGTGDLIVQGSNAIRLRSATGENMGLFNANGAVSLQYDNSTKFATTSTGIDVTGTVTADGLTVDGDVAIASDLPSITLTDNNNSSSRADIDYNFGYLTLDADANAVDAAEGIQLNIGGTTHFGLATGGDISFYEDTGTTVKLTWSAADESLGLGTTNLSSHRFRAVHATNASADFRATDGNDRSFEIDVISTVSEVTIGTGTNNPLAFKVNDTERMRIDSSGNLLVGTTATDPQSSSSNSGVQIGEGFIFAGRTGEVAILNRQTTDGDIAVFRKDGTTVGSIRSQSGLVTDIVLDPRLNNYATGHGIGGTQVSGVPKIIPRDGSGNALDAGIDLGDSAGRFKDLYLSGVARADSAQIGTTSITDAKTNIVADTGQWSIKCFNAASGSQNLIAFNVSGGATNVGAITTDGTNTTYATSSDQRLKDNIVDAPSASDDIDAIQVRSFDWKVNGSHQKYGMVAQELQSVAPEAVSGDADSDEMMGVDYSKLVPMLVKEIQSLRARVAQLEGAN